MMLALVSAESTYEKDTITIITYFQMFPLIFEKRLNCVANQLPLNGKIKQLLLENI